MGGGKEGGRLGSLTNHLWLNPSIVRAQEKPKTPRRQWQDGKLSPRSQALLHSPLGNLPSVGGKAIPIWGQPNQYLATLSISLRPPSLWKKLIKGDYLQGVAFSQTAQKMYKAGQTPQATRHQGWMGSWMSSVFHFYNAPKNHSPTMREVKTASCSLKRHF